MNRALRVVAAAALLVGGCAAPEAAPDATPEVAPPVAVRVVPARRGPIASELRASGETAALTIVRLASPVGGRVTAVSVQPGDHVKSGVVAARVLPQENEAALHGFGVLADSGALQPDEKPAAERLVRDLAGRDISLRAPFDGIVSDRLHNPGEQVAPSDVLVEIFDPRSLVVLCQVPVARSGEVRAGQPVTVHVSGAAAAGHVTAIVAAVSPQSLTVPVRIALAAPPQPPLLRAAAECRITVAANANALLVPRRALLTDDHQAAATLMVAADGVAHLRSVRVGLRGDDAIEVEDGLADGDLVIVAGQYGLADGTAVAAEPANAE